MSTIALFLAVDNVIFYRATRLAVFVLVMAV